VLLAPDQINLAIRQCCHFGHQEKREEGKIRFDLCPQCFGSGDGSHLLVWELIEELLTAAHCVLNDFHTSQRFEISHTFVAIDPCTSWMDLARTARHVAHSCYQCGLPG